MGDLAGHFRLCWPPTHVTCFGSNSRQASLGYLELWGVVFYKTPTLACGVGNAGKASCWVHFSLLLAAGLLASRTPA